MVRRRTVLMLLSAEQWESTKLPNLLQKFSADDIYNADETG
jgi:hypothetical protein